MLKPGKLFAVATICTLVAMRALLMGAKPRARL